MEPIPVQIGRYVVESLVGAGGMGQIYKAHDPDIRRTVAIKLISTRLMSSADRGEYIRRFRREAEAAARCAHPNIVSIYDYAMHEGQPFLAMEFVHGRSVRQMIEESPMAVPDAIHVMLQVLDALASAHEQGVIHQDIKPANILLTPQMRAKVTDFGISRFANADTTSISSSMGTPSYMAPEQCRGGPVDHRADLFAAGATLFEMVAGERAFGGHNSVEVTHHIMYDRLPLLPAAARSAAPRLQLVLERAMGKHPEDRFSSGHEMAEALRQILGTVAADVQDRMRRPSAGMTATFVMPPAAPAGRSGPPPRGAPPSAAPSAGPPPSLPTPGRVQGRSPIDASTRQMLEQKLIPYLGPIARVMVRSAADRASGLDALCAELAAAVPEGTERESFRREVAPLLRTRPPVIDDEPSHGSIGSFHEPELERAQRALTQYVGPIARVLVRRAARDASSIDGMWQALSMHIELPAERAAFLRQRHE
ncbi:MAG: protein kinase [Reyranella sp.]|uniref:serine/threonine-protein kinase n=1 Tax=Reyranella sp. TaxID=1929291 RepID=UPI001AD10234|nr:serine/threonine protein kinase [Reyranella sp.]MBN9086430.1 protein kinase [Reyranella sp.]